VSISTEQQQAALDLARRGLERYGADVDVPEYASGCAMGYGAQHFSAVARALIAAHERFRAPIVCLCGSTRFKQAWIAENARLTGEGNIVLAVGLWGHHERVEPDPETKARLDALHLRKIDLCDWVWVLDIGGYVGESTRREVEYAVAHGKPVRYLSQESPEWVEPVDAIVAQRDLLTEALRQIAAETDAGRYDGKPEPCPVLDADTMWGIARTALREAGLEPAQ
jgi:hypothetical protein